MAEDTKIVKSLLLNFNTEQEVLNAKQIGKQYYDDWIKLEREFFNIAVEICDSCHYQFKKIFDSIDVGGKTVNNLYNCVRFIFSAFGDINGYKIWIDANLIKQMVVLIVEIPPSVYKEHKFNRFRILYERFLAKIIMIQKSKTSEQLDAEEVARLKERKERAKARKRAKRKQELEAKKKAQNSIISVNSKTMFSNSEDNVLYILKDKAVCEKNGHTVEKIAVIFVTIDKKEILLEPAFHCESCGMFYMYENVYNKCKKDYGVLIGNIKKNPSSNHSNLYSDLAKNSPLNLCGYSTNQKDNLSAMKRQQIITHVLEMGIMTKDEVLDLLKWLIDSLGKKPQNDLARKKWEGDYWFTKKLYIDNQPIYKIKYIKRF